MKFLRSSTKRITLDFCVNDYRYSGGKFNYAASFGRVVAKEQKENGYLIAYQDLGDLLYHQEYGDFDGDYLDESFNKAIFCPFEEFESGKVRFFKPKTLNAFIYLEGETGFRHLCSFNPSDFDEVSEVSSKTEKKKKRVVVFENITTVFNAKKKPRFTFAVSKPKRREGESEFGNFGAITSASIAIKSFLPIYFTTIVSGTIGKFATGFNRSFNRVQSSSGEISTF